MKRKIKSNQSSTICWDCERCGGKCPWSAKLKPVDGWTADEDFTYFHGIKEKSYVVRDCPLFEERHTKTTADSISDDAAVLMMSGIIKRAQHDFIDSYIAEKYGIIDAVEHLDNRRTGGTERLDKVIYEIKSGVIRMALGEKTEALLEKFEKNAKEVINIMELWIKGATYEGIAEKTGKTKDGVEQTVKKYKKSRNYKIIKDFLKERV